MSCFLKLHPRLGLSWPSHREQNPARTRCELYDLPSGRITDCISKTALDELSPDTIRSNARLVAEREISTQKQEFQQLGIMADWSTQGTYRTLGELILFFGILVILSQIVHHLDHSYELRQLRIFQNMVGKG